MKILGIDPGTSRIGYGLIETNKGLRFLDYGVLEISGADKLRVLAKRYETLLKKLAPDLVSIEKLFFAKNKKTALEVAQARGVIILKTSEAGLPIKEFGPMEVKAAVTGYGKSDKQAVALMVKRFLNLKSLEGHDDASDALAIAITASRDLTLEKRYL